MPKSKIIIILTCVILLIFTVFYFQVVRTALVANKEVISVLKDIITLLAIIIGGILSYVKFFMARTIFTKADIEFDIQTVESPHGTVLHVVRVGVTNKGTVVIFRPRVTLRVQKFTDGIAESESFEELANGTFLAGNGESLELSIDVGERVYFSHFREFDKRIWALLYDVEVSCGDAFWQSSIARANKAV